MGVSYLQHRSSIGYFNNILSSRPIGKNNKNKQNLNRNFSMYNIDSYQKSPSHAQILLVYIYIILMCLMISMHIDVCNLQTFSITSTINHTNIPYFHSLPLLQILLNWAILIKFFSPNRQIKHCTIFSILRKYRIQRCTFANFWYQMFFKNSSTCLYYLSMLNLLLIVIVTPSIVNPGPETRPLSVFYNNVQGLVNPNELKSNTPRLNMTKLHELHGYIFQNKPDIVILNETWLKPNILDSEVLPSSIYKVFREDRTEKTHPWDPSQPKKYRKSGGGVLIAHRKDIDIESTKVGFIKVQAEILSVNMKLASGKKLIYPLFIGLGTWVLIILKQLKNFFIQWPVRKN